MVGAKVAGMFGAGAGLTSGLGATVINVQFWQALIVAAITGLLTAIGTIVGAWLAARVTHHEIEPMAVDVQHVKRAVGADRRATDEPPRDEPDPDPDGDLADA